MFFQVMAKFVVPLLLSPVLSCAAKFTSPSDWSQRGRSRPPAASQAVRPYTSSADDTPKKPDFQQVYFNKETGDYRRLTRWIKEILHAIDNGSFFPNFGWACKQCPFKRACWLM